MIQTLQLSDCELQRHSLLNSVDLFPFQFSVRNIIISLYINNNINMLGIYCSTSGQFINSKQFATICRTKKNYMMHKFRSTAKLPRECRVIIFFYIIRNVCSPLHLYCRISRSVPGISRYIEIRPIKMILLCTVSQFIYLLCLSVFLLISTFFMCI